MLSLIPAHPSHAHMLDLQPAQKDVGGGAPMDVLVRMCAKGNAFSAVDQEARIVYGMAGLEHVWDGRALLWSMLHKDAGKHMLSLVRMTKRALELYPCKRVEAYVAPNHIAGIRLIRMLGFEREGLMKGFWNGHDYAMWARISEG